jgi:alpha-D-xyloside xylohydrolase
MLGDALLVAPVFTSEGAVDVYLPPGRWTHLLSGVEKRGGWHHEVHDVFSLPLYVRENTLLAVGAHDDTVVYDHADGVTLELYALGDGRSATCTVSGDQGESLAVTAQRQGHEIVVTASATKPWRLLVVGQVVTCDGGETTRNERGTLIEGKPSLRLTLSAG